MTSNILFLNGRSPALSISVLSVPVRLLFLKWYIGLFPHLNNLTALSCPQKRAHMPEGWNQWRHSQHEALHCLYVCLKIWGSCVSHSRLIPGTQQHHQGYGFHPSTQRVIQSLLTFLWLIPWRPCKCSPILEQVLLINMDRLNPLRESAKAGRGESVTTLAQEHTLFFKGCYLRPSTR